MHPLSSFTCLRAAAILVAAATVVSTTGCSRPVGSVGGRVTYQSNPLKGGNVTFISTDGQPSASASINEDGTYKVPRLTSGSYKVCVETSSLKPPPAPPMMGGQRGVKATKLDPNTPVPEGYTPSSPADASLAIARANSLKKYVPIPEQYEDSGKTDLKYDFPGGDQTHDIELK